MKRNCEKDSFLTKLGETIINKLTVFVLNVFLIAVISSVVQAEQGKNTEDPFVFVTSVIPGGCIIQGTDPLLAQWTYLADTEPKFGGDVFFYTMVTIEDGFKPMVIEFKIVRSSRENPQEDYTGQMYYSCVGLTCTGKLDLEGFENIVAAQIEAKYPDFLSYLEPQLGGIYVKILNSGKENGRQNYELTPVNVCSD